MQKQMALCCISQDRKADWLASACLSFLNGDLYTSFPMYQPTSLSVFQPSHLPVLPRILSVRIISKNGFDALQQVGRELVLQVSAMQVFVDLADRCLTIAIPLTLCTTGFFTVNLRRFYEEFTPDIQKLEYNDSGPTRSHPLPFLGPFPHRVGLFCSIAPGRQSISYFETGNAAPIWRLFN